MKCMIVPGCRNCKRDNTVLFKNKLEYYAFLTLAGLFQKIGITRTRKTARFLGALFYYIVPIRKKTVIENLKIAFPKKSNKEILELTKNSYKNFATTFAELLVLQTLTKEELTGILDLGESKEMIEKYYNSGKSFFLLTGHFGNWELTASFPLFFSRRFNAMAKAMRNPFVSDWTNKSREKFGSSVVLLGPSLREIFKLLKENEVILVVGDQRGPRESIRVNFFNRPTAVFTGTAALAVRTSTPIVMILIARKKDFNYKIIAQELKYDDLTCPDDEKIQIICQRYFSFLEDVVKQYPEQWFWMHKIWKY